MSVRRHIAAASAIAMAACAAPSTHSAEPAVLARDAVSRAALLAAVTQALAERQITLPADALADSSVLVLEHARPRDAGGRLLQGREPGKPESFRLMKHGKECVLVHERTGKEFVLEGAGCTAGP